MLKFLIAIVLFLGFLYALGAQSHTPIMAPNVSVGEHTVWSAYPDKADFVLNLTTQRLLLSLFTGPEASDWNSVHYAAHVGQVAPHVYRAEVTPMFWVEVNTLSGETFWYNSCITACYRLPCPEYSYEGNH